MKVLKFWAASDFWKIFLKMNTIWFDLTDFLLDSLRFLKVLLLVRCRFLFTLYTGNLQKRPKIHLLSELENKKTWMDIYK